MRSFGRVKFNLSKKEFEMKKKTDLNEAQKINKVMESAKLLKVDEFDNIQGINFLIRSLNSDIDAVTRDLLSCKCKPVVSQSEFTNVKLQAEKAWEILRSNIERFKSHSSQINDIK